ncbi:MAG: MFS transporter, partial [Chloroflexi bacterium]|nr:MFS transporter [Chloroflexota bacterium]
MTTFYLVPIVAYEITGSYAASGFAQAGMVAQLVLGPFGGVIADRYKKKPLVLGSQI